MARQLTLLDTPPTWRLSEATREAGRKGIADARASLQAALARRQELDAAQPQHDRTAA
jgi:hypothetical protein